MKLYVEVGQQHDKKRRKTVIQVEIFEWGFKRLGLEEENKLVEEGIAKQLDYE